MSALLPIASLDPAASPPSEQFIRGVVTLVWPFSSSTRQFALLLSDPDFRLRSKRGQVRVRFTGASAKAVAEKHVGIGDVVELGLEGAKWGEDREREKTPGRSVEGELVFGRKAGLSVYRDGRDGEESETVEVDAPPSPPAAETREGLANGERYAQAVTPARVANGDVHGLLRRSLNGSLTDAGWTYSSPAFAKRVRLSEESGLLDSAFDPFVDGEAGSPTKDKRSSFGTGLRWRYQSRTPSPVKESFRDIAREEEAVVSEPVGVGSPSRARHTGKETVEEARAKGEDLADSEMLAEGEGMAEGEDDVASIARDDSEDIITNVEPSARRAASLKADIQTTASRTPPGVARSTEDGPRSAESSLPTMAPPALPQLRMPSLESLDASKKSDEPTDAGSEGPSTPKLEPVKSPTLPLPSPFPVSAPSSLSAALNFAPLPYKANSLFGSLGSAASVIERRRLSGRRSQDQLQPPQPAALPPPRTPLPEPTTTTATRPDGENPDVAPRSTAKEAADVSGVNLTNDSAEDTTMTDNVAPVQETDVNQSFSTTIADDDMYHDYARSLTATMDEENEAGRTSHDDELALPETEGSTLSKNDGVHTSAPEEDHIETEKTRDEAVLLEESTSSDSESTKDASTYQGMPETTAKLPADAFSLDGASGTASFPEAPTETEVSKPPSSSERMQATNAARPSAPTKKPPPSSFSLDGTSSTPPPTRVTRQSEKERVKKSTYRNLFGLRSPQKDDLPKAAVPEPVRQEERFIPGWFFEVTAHPADDGGSEGIAAEAQESEKKVVSTQTPGPAAKDPGGSEDVIMLDGDDETDSPEPPAAEPATASRVEQSPAADMVVPPSKMQVIELDASSAVEDEEETDTPKALEWAPDLPSSSPVIQDSLEDSQHEEFAVSEDERIAQRMPLKSAAQRLKEVEPGATSPLSSPLPEERLAGLARETAGARVGVTHAVREHSAPQQDVHMESSPMPKTAGLAILEQEEEEHIAPPRSTAATTVVELGSSSESEEFPSSPVLRPQQEPTQAPSYPTLPLSPSNSQSLQDMQSQAAMEHSVRSKLPPTPQLTQRESSVQTDGRASQKTPAPKPLRRESSLRAEIKAAESPITPQTKTPSRRSARLRSSNVPDVLSEWFSPRASGLARDQGKAEFEDREQHDLEEDSHGIEAAATNGHTSRGKRAFTRAQSSGFATAHSYFTPLSKIPELLNPASQGSNTVDILAVVTDSTKEPVRAKTGPKDYFTIFRIADSSLPSAVEGDIRVEVFRPYKATLPTAEVGDVVLLRAFTVKSKKRSPYLLSMDASAWCVWRFPDATEAAKPIWARKGKVGAASDDSVQEEVKGPPVEFGDEERDRAEGLREWWLELRRESGKEAGLPAKL